MNSKQLHKVTFYPEKIELFVKENCTILEVARQAKIMLDAPCGGKGTCKKCKVEISLHGIKQSVLACQTFVLEDLAVYLPKEGQHHILSKGIEPVFHFNPILKKIEKRSNNCSQQFLFQNEVIDINIQSKHWYMSAFDIGTTTIVGYLLDGNGGEQLAVRSILNPQTIYGADVMERCRYAIKKDTGISELQNSVLSGINELLVRLAKEVGIDTKEIVISSIVGNVCMNHFFAGLSIACLLSVPYQPKFYDWFWKYGKEFSLNMNSDGIIVFLPNIGSFVGADTSSAMLNANLDREEELTLLLDIGTNGEFVLGNKEERIACSTAAGPAFEGANITFGMRGTSGAIDHVWKEGEQLAISTINKDMPIGICGSGLVDVAAFMLEYGFMDETGKIFKQSELKQEEAIKNKNRIVMIEEEIVFMLVFPSATKHKQGIYITQQDIRELQLAKGAILAGIITLLKKKNKKKSDVKKVFLAGAFGNFMSIKNATKINLLPKEWTDRVIILGNAAGEGAKEILREEDAFTRCVKLAKETQVFELALEPEFQQDFLSCMNFIE